MLSASASNNTTLWASAVIAAVVAGLFTLVTQTWLLERKARIDYKLPARQRLYEALGPLRTQLLFSSRDLVRRVQNHPGSRWNMKPSDYYAKSFIWRLLRPLAVGQLIEGQLTIADFSVDPKAVALLRYKAAMDEMLTGGEVVEGLEGVNWATQTQHLFADNLRTAAAKLIFDDDGVDRVMGYAQFDQSYPDLMAQPGLKELTTIFDNCVRNGHTLLGNPIFWLRVVGYAYVCNQLMSTHGSKLGFRKSVLAVQSLLEAVPDRSVASGAAGFQARFDSIIEQSL